MPVRSEVLEHAPFRARLTLFGRVEPAEQVTIKALEAGSLRYSDRFRSGLRTGERVRRGEELFVLDNDQLMLDQRQAELTAEAANAELRRVRQGVEGGYRPASELEHQEIESELASARLRGARKRVARLAHQAPRDGILTVAEAIAAGTEVAAGEVIAELASDGNPRIEAWAAASDLPLLHPGLEVEALLPGGETVVARGVVREVAARVDAHGTARLVVEISEAIALPPIGEGLELEVLLESKAGALTVPEEALVISGGISALYVLEPAAGAWVARRRNVGIGTRGKGRVEVLDGLQAGERVAVRGVELLSDGIGAVDTGDE